MSVRLAALVASIVALCIGGTSASATTLTRGPYLQLLTTESATIAWNTDAPAVCGLAIGPVGTPASLVTGPASTTCAIPVTGLGTGMQYAYTPLAGGVPLGSAATFRTDDPTRPFSFLVFGDSGCACAGQYAVRDAMLKTPADFILHTGDMVYPAGAAPDLDPKFFAPYRDLLRRLVLWPCLGNHDFATAAGGPWRAAFWTPANNAAGSENYYSFDAGNAHIAVLDSNESTSPGSAQYTFLDTDLAASAARWKFVVFHHTIYSSGTHGSNLTIQTNLVPLFDRHAVDIVFMGHDHDYERTQPLRANVVVAPGMGTVYITTGGGGNEFRPVGTSPFTAYAETAGHFTRVAIDGGSLLAQMVRVDGAIRDTMTLVKGPPGPAPRCGDDLVNQASEQCDGADHPACSGTCTPDCTCTAMCGDGRVNQPTEACDGSDTGACPGLCLSDCRCGDPLQFLTVGPAADTFVEAGTQATWDHGAADHVDVDLSPAGIAYFKFDLTGVSVPITRATLTLMCTNASPDGGTIHPVADTSWPEGDRTGLDSTSASGPGIKWSDVDTDANGVVNALDTSPWVPDLTRPVGAFPPVVSGQSYSAVVTAAVQGAPAVYALAIVNDDSNGTTYSTREHGNASHRPRLRLELAVPMPTTTTTTAPTTTRTTTTSTTTTRPSTSTTTTTQPPTTSTTTTTRPPTTSTTTTTRPPTTSTTTRSPTSTTTTTRQTTTTRNPTTTTTTLPAGPRGVVLADASLHEKPAPKNFGADPVLEVDGTAGKRVTTLVRIGVNGVGSRQVLRARLRLQVAALSTTGPGGRIRTITSCTWNELSVTWSTKPALDGPVLATAGTVRPGTVVDFDVTSAVRSDGTYCFAIDSPTTGGVAYNAREGSPQRPTIVLDFAP